jgi:hypothetical protein
MASTRVTASSKATPRTKTGGRAAAKGSAGDVSVAGVPISRPDKILWPATARVIQSPSWILRDTMTRWVHG